MLLRASTKSMFSHVVKVVAFALAVGGCESYAELSSEDNEFNSGKLSQAQQSESKQDGFQVRFGRMITEGHLLGNYHECACGHV